MANFKHAEDDPKHVNMSGKTPATSAAVQPTGESFDAGRNLGLVSCAIPSFAAASELLPTPYSCLVMNTHRRHIALPPVYLNAKRTGIQEELDAELLRFSQSLNGVPLAYDNIKIVGHHGNIYDDSGYIHMDIEANFIVFQPRKGQKMIGEVNKLGISHVGCLVHGCFNASISKPNLVSVDTWRYAGPRIGAKMEFEMTALDADIAGVLLIRGQLDRTRVRELLAIGESSELGVPGDQPEPPETEPNSEPTEESPVDTPKKKKKKKKRVEEDERDGETSTPFHQVNGSATPELNVTITEANSNGAGEKRKKKNKHVKKEEEEVVTLSTMEVNVSDSNGYLSDKQSKKRRRETGSGVASSFGQVSVPPKSKKRKSDIEQLK